MATRHMRVHIAIIGLFYLNHHFFLELCVRHIPLLNSVEELISVLGDHNALLCATFRAYKPHVVPGDDSISSTRGLPHDDSAEGGHRTRGLGI